MCFSSFLSGVSVSAVQWILFFSSYISKRCNICLLLFSYIDFALKIHSLTQTHTHSVRVESVRKKERVLFRMNMNFQVMFVFVECADCFLFSGAVDVVSFIFCSSISMNVPLFGRYLSLSIQIDSSCVPFPLACILNLYIIDEAVTKITNEKKERPKKNCVQRNEVQQHHLNSMDKNNGNE